MSKNTEKKPTIYDNLKKIGEHQGYDINILSYKRSDGHRLEVIVQNREEDRPPLFLMGVSTDEELKKAQENAVIAIDNTMKSIVSSRQQDKLRTSRMAEMADKLNNPTKIKKEER